jgi:polysaccharide deacetylase family protein (PEP-CTERM system associated)
MTVPGSEPEVPHIFTVDVEEYFHALALSKAAPRSRWHALPSRVEQATGTILDLLAKHDTVATFFVVGWVAERFPGLVRRIAVAGHEIASHGYWHRTVTAFEPEEFREDLRHSRIILEQVTGRRVHGFRAPSFSIVPGIEWAFDVLLEEGFTWDSSLFPIRRPEYGYPDTPSDPYLIRREGGAIVELPLATTSMMGLRLPAAGGAYLRHLPYGLTRRAFREHADRGVPAMFYMHPWEVDPGQPRLDVPWISRVRHYRGLDHMLERIERLLYEFSFTSVERALDVPALRAAA